MQTDPMQELARLREYYHPMSDEELLELEGQMKDLSPTAQQVLTEELTLRGIGKAAAKEAGRVFRGGGGGDLDADGLVAFPSRAADPVFDGEKQFVDGKGQVFTYKTLLCECDKLDQAMMLKELLRRNGIESWIEAPGKGRNDLGIPPRIEVGADQLEQARLIADQPMPEEIIDMFQEIEEDVSEYEPPKCPQCGDEDPILENAEPVNQWLCEGCGKRWEDASPESEN